MSILDTPIISRIRRNHGLEHATLNILSQWAPRRPLAGYSIPSGFFLVGDVPTQEVRQAVMEALSRLQNGEHHLALHPGCGTNYAVSGLLAGSLAWMSMLGAKGKRTRFQRLPLVIALVMAGTMVGQQLGPRVQELVTTSGDPLGMTVVDIFPVQFGSFSLHRVITRD